MMKPKSERPRGELGGHARARNPYETTQEDLCRNLIVASQTPLVKLSSACGVKIAIPNAY